ncbi:MAG: stage II sporulation protein M [Bacteroidetes bacterium]|nr:stage II sporulation protein M [Bacteroidota bacterium]MCB9226639.1 stage II sporulation protein M [Chitinophagales bacterium]
MKETKFVNQNKEKWQEFEKLSQSKTKNPDRLSELYVQITDDLSYAKTYYKNRMVRAYLNNLSQKVYLSIYKTKKSPFKNLWNFWQEELPYIIYQCRKELLLSLAVFLIAAGIGAFSVLQDANYAEIVTSPSYVEMTKENIKNGDPMYVYKDEDPLPMFLRIAWNNIRVSFNVFVMGVLAGVGTIFMLILNGTMLGGFQFFFYDKGVFWESVITVWQHGTIEILCIIIAGGAGLVLGRGLIAPGAYPRLQSFQMAARKGLLIMLSIIPLIIIAAFIEGYITRLTDANIFYRIGLIILSLTFMIGYYVYYPFKKYKQGFSQEVKAEKTIESKDLSINYKKIKTAVESFADSFSLYAANFGKFVGVSLFFAGIYGFIYLFFFKEETLYIDVYDFGKVENVFFALMEVIFSSFNDIFSMPHSIPFFSANTILLATLIGLSTRLVIKNAQPLLTIKPHRIILSSLIISLLINVIFLVSKGIGYWTFLCLIPFLAYLNIATNINKNFMQGVQQGFSLLFVNFMSTVGLFFLLLLITTLVSLMNISIISLWMVDFISQNFLMDGEQYTKFYTFISGFIGVGTFAMIYPIFYLAFGIQFLSNAEKQNATHLQDKINALFLE